MFLILHPEGATPAAISEALWPGQTDTSNLLRSAMKRVRAHLKQATGLDQAFILYGDGRYRPDRRVIGCDAWQFEAATELAGRASGHDAERAAALADAVTLYRGQLLDGADYLWADAYREAVRHHALQAYVRYAAALETDDPEAALAALERALAIDPYNETLYLRVMTRSSSSRFRAPVPLAAPPGRRRAMPYCSGGRSIKPLYRLGPLAILLDPCSDQA